MYLVIKTYIITLCDLYSQLLQALQERVKSKRLKDVFSCGLNKNLVKVTTRLNASVHIGTLILSVYNIIVRIPHFIGTQKQSCLGASHRQLQ